MSIHEYAGVWVTPDGGICKVLLADGRFQETRAGKPERNGQYESSDKLICFRGEFGSFEATVVSYGEISSAGVTLYRLPTPTIFGDG